MLILGTNQKWVVWIWEEHNLCGRIIVYSSTHSWFSQHDLIFLYKHVWSLCSCFSIQIIPSGMLTVLVISILQFQLVSIGLIHSLSSLASLVALGLSYLIFAAALFIPGGRRPEHHRSRARRLGQWRSRAPGWGTCGAVILQMVFREQSCVWATLPLIASSVGRIGRWGPPMLPVVLRAVPRALRPSCTDGRTDGAPRTSVPPPALPGDVRKTKMFALPPMLTNAYL